jgi:hypothetical protein
MENDKNRSTSKNSKNGKYEYNKINKTHKDISVSKYGSVNSSGLRVSGIIQPK